MKHIRFENWEHYKVYQAFENGCNPFYSINFRLDVTRLKRYCSHNGLSFYHTLCYLSTEAINDVSAFHYCVQNHNLYYLDERFASFTERTQDSEQYKIITLPKCTSLAQFCEKAAQSKVNQQDFIDESLEGEHLLYLSCIPWVDITAMTNAHAASLPEESESSIPRVCWGKYICSNERYELGYSIEVNHRFVDGYHIGLFAKSLTEHIEALPLPEKEERRS